MAVTATVDWPLAGAIAAVTGNVAADDEAGIVTEAGTIRVAASLETATVTPPAGAGPDRATVQVPVEPAMRLVELHVSNPATDGPRVKVAVTEPPKRAVRVTLRLLVTLPAMALNVVEDAAAGTTTDAGIVSSALVSVNCTVCEAVTLRFSLTVQMLEPPEVSDVGLQLRELADAMGATMTEAVREEPFNAAVIVMLTLVVTGPAVAVKAAEEAPTGTVTVGGMTKRELLSDRETMAPPVGAG